MLKIIVHVNRPAGQAIGIKEQIAMDLERYGDTLVVSVDDIPPKEAGFEQMQLGDMRHRR